jgi:VIT1/CCC1 family predicted Fe2+/Mn2+ transporter
MRRQSCDPVFHIRRAAPAAGHPAAPAALRVPVTFAVVLVALGLAGAVSAHLGGSSIRRAVLRLVIGGALGLAFTYGTGHLLGTAIG